MSISLLSVPRRVSPTPCERNKKLKLKLLFVRKGRGREGEREKEDLREFLWLLLANYPVWKWWQRRKELQMVLGWHSRWERWRILRTCFRWWRGRHRTKVGPECSHNYHVGFQQDEALLHWVRDVRHCLAPLMRKWCSWGSLLARVDTMGRRMESVEEVERALVCLVELLLGCHSAADLVPMPSIRC